MTVIVRLFTITLALFLGSTTFFGAGSARAESTFRIALSAAPPSKGNPFSTVGTTPTFFWTAIYDRLTDIDNEGNIVPELALS
ncbi:MAG: hypothetical protein GKS03_13460 [Alphaproteobacteria bacterium]|nr:hypothetical protein [Alphaproteobacteria bacterium]